MNFFAWRSGERNQELGKVESIKGLLMVEVEKCAACIGSK